jgi:N-acetyl-anhydromuramyl-L-alanine amidase AmpD
VNRIIWHHTGGAYRPNDVDRAAYHYLIDGDGVVHDGRHPVAGNMPGKLVKGQYAAHTRNLNAGSIGVAVCAMGNGQWSTPYTNTPVEEVQVREMVALTSRLCRAWGIEPTRRTVLSHAEVEPTLGVAQRNKWDFDYDPLRVIERRDPVAVGEALRLLVVKELDGPVVPIRDDRPTLRQGDRGGDVRDLQRMLKVTADGIFGPRTRNAVVTFQRANQLLPDGTVGRQTWAALS